jgi:hypothetical protein
LHHVHGSANRAAQVVLGDAVLVEDADLPLRCAAAVAAHGGYHEGLGAGAAQFPHDGTHHRRLWADAAAAHADGNALALEVRGRELGEGLGDGRIDVGYRVVGEALADLHETRQLDVEAAGHGNGNVFGYEGHAALASGRGGAAGPSRGPTTRRPAVQRVDGGSVDPRAFARCRARA